jgi:hypothetical protein
MRVRYERREPRVEDIARINELKTVVDSQEKDICQLTEQLRELQLQMQSYQNLASQQNSNQSNANIGGGGKKNRGRNNNNKNSNNNSKNNNANNNNQQAKHNQQQQQPNVVIVDEENEQQQTRVASQNKQQRARPPPLIKTVIYEEENENELYEQQIREEQERAAASSSLDEEDDEFLVELVPESPDINGKPHFEEISEAHLLQDHEILNQNVIPSPTPDHKNQEIAIEVISTIEPSNFQVIKPMVTNRRDLDLD